MMRTFDDFDNYSFDICTVYVYCGVSVFSISFLTTNTFSPWGVS